MCIENKDSLCTSEQRVYTPTIIAAARALNKCVATSCGIDAEDQWKTYSADFLNDAQMVLDASGLPVLVTVLQDVVRLAQEMHCHWDNDRDTKVGKYLLALAGQLPGYDKRTDELHAAIANATGGAKENFKSETGFENKPADSFKARAQEPVHKRCKRCNDTGLVSDGEIDNIGGEQLEVPIECVKDCPDCVAPVEPVKQEPVALLQLAADALVYHTEQTRPIQNTIDVLAAIQKFKEEQR